MAAASSCCTLPLLRRPLPPKPSPPPSSISSRPKRDVVSSTGDRLLPETATRQAPSKGKVFSPVCGLQYHGDVPLPKLSVVQSYKQKGPDPLPARPPRKPRELPAEAFIKDSYEPPPPVFTLRDFLKQRQSRGATEDANDAVISDQNYEKLTSWLNTNKPHQVQVHHQEIDSKIEVPDVTPRKPAGQLLIEMQVPAAGMETASPEQDPYLREQQSQMLPVTPAVSKLTIPASRPLPTIGQDGVTTEADRAQTVGQVTTVKSLDTPPEERQHTQAGVDEEKSQGVQGPTEVKSERELETTGITQEPLGLGDWDSDERGPSITREKTLTFEFEKDKAMTYPRQEIVLGNSPTTFFQGEVIPRTSSPFVNADDYQGQASPLEAIICNAMLTGARILNLKAHFLSGLPSLTPLSGMVTHLNVSFNDFWVFPPEILELKELISLKMRDNPIKEIPHGIKGLKRLKILEMSFNLITSLPTSLFQLKHLEFLDLSYNRLSFIPNEIGNLRLLQELNVEGNQLGALPTRILLLRLKHLKINNNFTHPLFWKGTISSQPQRLVDLCALAVAISGVNYKSTRVPQVAKDILERAGTCDCCGGPIFGEGVRLIKAPKEIFGLRNLPVLFLACSQYCRKQFLKNHDAIQYWFQKNNVTVTQGS